ncbi:MAG: Dyp-type peroxidase [bacterium]
MTSERSARTRLTRRGLLAGGAAALAGAGAAGGAFAVGDDGPGPRPLTDGGVGQRTVPFHGVHQAGVETPAQAFATFVGFDVRPGVEREALTRWMKLWTGDAERLTAGHPALADTDPELAQAPASLTITIGVGRGFLEAAGREELAPAWLRPLPAFSVDALDERWSGGDVVVQVCADDQVAVSHAVRMLSKDARAFATVRWVQQGFLHAPGAVPRGQTPRNLMGQLDGTANPPPGSDEFSRVVWIDDAPSWLRHGTSLVLRRIRIEAEQWDKSNRQGKEETVGRRLDDGAPLTGDTEHDEPDFDAANEIGLPVIPPWSHIRRARPDDARQRIMRRPYNYDDGPGQDGRPNVGLLFASYQADVDAQFVPIQRRLDELDMLNDYTTPVGSAVVAVLPGVAEGGWFGEALLS